MLHDVLRNLGGIQTYGLVSLCLFIGIFGALMIWSLGQKRSHLERMARLPLESDTEAETAKNAYERATE